MSGPYRMTVIYCVPDWETYKVVSSEATPVGRPGVLRRSVFRSLDDPNEVMVELEFASADAATAFLPSMNLSELFERIGLEIYPPVFIGQEVDELRYEAT